VKRRHPHSRAPAARIPLLPASSALGCRAGSPFRRPIPRFVAGRLPVAGAGRSL